MSELFIAPEGARQWELHPDKAAERGVPFLWVYPAAETVCPGGHRTAWKEYQNNLYVCGCGGKLIE